MPFKAVVFDLFGTLVPGFAPHLFSDSLKAMADAVGVDRDFFRDAWIKDTHFERSVGTFDTIAANILHICRMAGVSPGDEGLERAVAIRDDFTRTILELRPDAVATLTAIRDAGLGVAMVSDCSAEVPELWASTPLADLIEHPIFSCTAGMKKPDPLIFLEASRRLGVPPEECLYVGDGMSQELTGAAAVGMHPVLIAPSDEEAPDYGESQRHDWEGDRVERLSEILDMLAIDG